MQFRSNIFRGNLFINTSTKKKILNGKDNLDNVISYVFLSQRSILLGYSYLEIVRLLIQMHIVELDCVHSIFKYYTT